VIGAAILVVVIGGWIGIDALVVTDEERLAELSDLLGGELDAERVEAGLGWVDPDVEPVEVNAMGASRLYGAGEAEAFEEDAREALARYRGEDLTRMSESISVEGDDGTISLRLMTSRGMVDVEFGLKRHGERWLVSRVYVH